MQKLVVANWKSHKNLSEAEAWCETMLGLEPVSSLMILTPPFSLLSAVQNLADERRDLVLGAQDISPYPAGSYTGAISARNLEGLNVQYVIVGHSERRQHFGESHQDVAKKVAQAIEVGVTPIVCLDEDYIADQAQAIDAELLERCVVAYEPLSSIGTGDSADPAEAAQIKDRIQKVFGLVPVLYGGSVDEDNVATFTEYFDGVIVGGESLDATEFHSLAQRA